MAPRRLSVCALSPSHSSSPDWYREVGLPEVIFVVPENSRFQQVRLVVSENPVNEMVRRLISTVK